MRSSSNFLPALNDRTQRNNNNVNNSIISPNEVESSLKLENRIFYMEKATARLIHAFESLTTRISKIESDNQNNNINIGALSKTITTIKDSNKDFITKQHIITERLVQDIHKTTNKSRQETSFINKEISDIRDSMQILSSNLQKNFNAAMTSAMNQCNDYNIQNSNSITSLRKITDQKISHLQELVVDSQKRAQTQNSSILDIINSNQKNQAEFQNSFKSFFEKFRDSMHTNLSALQESSQEQITYLDNVLRAEVKTRMKNTQNINKEIENKIFNIKEIINKNQRDNKRTWEFINKNFDSIKEKQNNQQNANKPLHKIITNLTKQFDEMSQQHLNDIKSIMQLNQDTSEKQFQQIKSLQIQIQQIWTKVSNQKQSISSPIAVPINNNNNNKYNIRPQSYRSDMSSTAAFNAIKHHLSNVPTKLNQNIITSNSHFVQELSANISPRQDDTHDFVVHNNHGNNENEPNEYDDDLYKDDENNNDIDDNNNADDEYNKVEETQDIIQTNDNNNADEYEDMDDEYEDIDAPITNADNFDNRHNNKVEEIQDTIQKNDIGKQNNDDEYEDDEYDNDSEVEIPNTENVDNENNNNKVEELTVENEYENDMDEVDDILADDNENNEENTSVNATKNANEANDNYSEKYENADNNQAEQQEQQEQMENEEITENINNVHDGNNEKDDDLSETEKALEMLEQEQNEINESVTVDNNHENNNDQYSDF